MLLARGTIHLHHAADLVELTHDGGEVVRVGNEDVEVNDGKPVRGRRRVEGRHARLRGRERGGNVEHEVEAVLGVNVERGLIRLLDVRAQLTLIQRPRSSGFLRSMAALGQSQRWTDTP